MDMIQPIQHTIPETITDIDLIIISHIIGHIITGMVVIIGTIATKNLSTLARQVGLSEASKTSAQANGFDS